MSRRTSDEGDRIATQLDGFRDGKNTTWKGREPDMSLDYNDAAASLPQRLQSGDVRYLKLISQGGIAARGPAGNKYGFITGSQITDYTSGGRKEGDNFAAVYTPDNNGIGIWRPVMISGDAFQWANRGSNGGKTDDGDTGYLLAEDKRNPQFSIAVYERTGTIPAAKVWDAYNDGLVSKDFGESYFNKSPKYQQQAAAAAAKDAQAAIAARAALPIPGVELTIIEGEGFWTATSADESASADGPHPGFAVAGTDFKAVSGGKSPSALGLPKPLLTTDDGVSARPLTREELNKVKQAAAAGDTGAAAALQQVGIQPPAVPQPSVFQRVGSFFG